MPVDVLHANDQQGQYPDSWYHATAQPAAARPRLAENRQAEICVVGAGYTGLSAALHLAQAGRDVVVVEAHRAGWGASGRNGGQVNSGQRVDQGRLEAMFGRAHAMRLWAMGEAAKTLVRRLVETHLIDCQLVPGIIHADHRRRFVDGSRAHVRLLNAEYGYDAIRFLERDEIRGLVASGNYHGGTQDAGAFHLHPLNYALGLARAAEDAGARIFENSEALRIAPGARVTVETAAGAVRAEHLVLACNGYLGGLDAGIARQVMPINNFVIATESLGPEAASRLIPDNSAVADSRFVINYFRRTADHRLLFGGGESYGYRFPRDIRAFVRRPMLGVFPQLSGARIEYGWGGTLAITMNRLPNLRRIDENRWSASGYSGQGIAPATLAGRILADAIAGRSDDFDVMSGLAGKAFPGGPAMRAPLLALAMHWYALRDRI